MDYSHLVARAIRMAAIAHGDTMNKDGTAYILHPLRLMMQAETDAERIVAVLHDTIEDTTLTLEELMTAGFPDEIIEALKGVTKRPEEAGDDGYEAFIRRAAQNPLALRVKLLDLHDNIDVTRLPSLGEWELNRTAKYHRAILYLRSYLADPDTPDTSLPETFAPQGREPE